MGNTDVGAIARAGTDTCTDFTAFDDLAVTTRLGPVVAVSPEDGSTAWMLPADGRVQGSTDPAVHDTTLYAVDGDGTR
ncbi:PQQ-like beta-propeller repeat protein [Streptomyces sp. NBC_00663]|uniref:hypothetical protein n=1 Tax=Streptomyces sp. NBC_00663 TaxID=2975801 RepID=UPI002E318DDD|nr:hypothetical protein [Streptomyces sp. NBC_00663]